MPEHDWLDLLRQAVASDPRGISGVANRIGYSRPTVSRVLAGTYSNPAEVASAVIAIYVRIECPHLHITLAPEDCATYAARRYSAITGAEVPHWRACRKCPHNTTRSHEEKEA